MSSDDTTLERFVKAQENCYNSVLKELRNGQKRSHWIWFIFPQAAELGPRLLECSNLLLRCENKDIGEILGYPDDAKLKSSMSLYYHACDEEVDSVAREVFQRVLNKYYHGSFDERTLDILNAWKKKTKT
eukprot:gene27836-36674_t